MCVESRRRSLLFTPKVIDRPQKHANFQFSTPGFTFPDTLPFKDCCEGKDCSQCQGTLL